MFFGILVLIIGIVLILQALGFFVGVNTWGFFLGLLFLAIGINLVSKKKACWHCEWFGHHKEHHSHHVHDSKNHRHTENGDE